MVAAIAVIVPASALAAPTPVTIGGPTAADWVAAGTTAGIGVTLVATPANETALTYSGTGADPVFDAPDRDSIGPVGPFGLGVDNTLIFNGQPGVTSRPPRSATTPTRRSAASERPWPTSAPTSSASRSTRSCLAEASR